MNVQPRYSPVMLRHCLPVLILSILSLQAQEAPAPNPAKDMAAAQQRIKKLSATEYDLDGIKINAATREVRIPTQVCLKKAPIEFMLTTDTGKTHETVLTTTIAPTATSVKVSPNAAAMVTLTTRRPR